MVQPGDQQWTWSHGHQDVRFYQKRRLSCTASSSKLTLDSPPPPPALRVPSFFSIHTVTHPGWSSPASATVSGQDQKANILAFAATRSLLQPVRLTGLCERSHRQHVKSKHGCVPTQLHGWTLTLEFDITFTCHSIYSRIDFFQPFKKCKKPFFVHGLYKNKWQGTACGPWSTLVISLLGEQRSPTQFSGHLPLPLESILLTPT